MAPPMLHGDARGGGLFALGEAGEVHGGRFPVQQEGEAHVLLRRQEAHGFVGVGISGYVADGHDDLVGALGVNGVSDLREGLERLDDPLVVVVVGFDAHDADAHHQWSQEGVHLHHARVRAVRTEPLLEPRQEAVVVVAVPADHHDVGVETRMTRGTGDVAVLGGELPHRVHVVLVDRSCEADAVAGDALRGRVPRDLCWYAQSWVYVQECLEHASLRNVRINLTNFIIKQVVMQMGAL